MKTPASFVLFDQHHQQVWISRAPDIMTNNNEPPYPGVVIHPRDLDEAHESALPIDIPVEARYWHDCGYLLWLVTMLIYGSSTGRAATTS